MQEIETRVENMRREKRQNRDLKCTFTVTLKSSRFCLSQKYKKKKITTTPISSIDIVHLKGKSFFIFRTSSFKTNEYTTF